MKILKISILSFLFVFMLASCEKNDNSINTNESDNEIAPNLKATPGRCDVEALNEICEAKSEPKLDERFAYDFRDDFLRNSEIGQTYIDYYYELSGINNNLNYFYQKYDFAKETFIKANLLLYGDGSSIVIDHEYYLECKNFINLYKTFSLTFDQYLIVEQIEEDLDVYYLKSKDEIIDLIK